MQRTAWWTAAAAIVGLAAGNARAKAPADGPHPDVGENSASHVGGNPVEGDGNAAQGKQDARESNGSHRDRGDEVLSFSGEHGRYHWSSGHWWYWLPSDRWAYYDNGAWQDYAAANSARPTNDQNVQIADDRYEFYNGQWWYAMPDERWVVWGSGSWRDYNGNEGPERRSSGYRGLPDEKAHVDNGVGREEHLPSNGAGQLPHDTQRRMERGAPNPGNAGHGPASSGTPQGSSGSSGGEQRK